MTSWPSSVFAAAVSLGLDELSFVFELFLPSGATFFASLPKFLNGSDRIESATKVGGSGFTNAALS